MTITFHGLGSLQRKENSSRNFCRRLRVRLRYRIYAPKYILSQGRVGNINPIPFRSRGLLLKVDWLVEVRDQSPPSGNELPCRLGPPDPRSTAVHTEPFSTSVYKVLTCIIATTTKICTSGGSTQPHGLSFDAHHCALLLVTAYNLAVTVWYRTNAPAPSIFRAGWFGRWVVTHSLADSDFHGHRPAVKINQHLLWYLMSVVFGSLTRRLVHPTSPVLLTKNGPLGTHIQCPTPIKRVERLTHLKFENQLKIFHPQYC